MHFLQSYTLIRQIIIIIILIITRSYKFYKKFQKEKRDKEFSLKDCFLLSGYVTMFLFFSSFAAFFPRPGPDGSLEVKMFQV